MPCVCALEHIYKCTRLHYSALFWAYKFKYICGTYAYGTLCGLFASRFLSLFIASTFPFYQYKIISFLFVSFLQKYFMSLITSTATHCHCLGNSRRPQQQRCRCFALKCLANGWLADWCIKCIYLNLRNLKLFHSLKTLNELWIHCRCRRQRVLCVRGKRTKHFKTVIVV